MRFESMVSIDGICKVDAQISIAPIKIMTQEKEKAGYCAVRAS